MTKNNRSLRLPAEWEPQSAVLVAWPHERTDWAPILDDARKCMTDIINAVSRRADVLVAAPLDICLDDIRSRGFDFTRVYLYDVPTDDTWARDFGPVTVIDGGRLKCLDFMFNGWGLKFASANDNLITMRLAGRHDALPGERVNRLSFVLEGGSIESDGEGTILTTSECLLSPNRNGGMTQWEIEEYLKEQFGADRVLWLDHGALAGDDTDSHIDTLARFASPDTIVYCGAGQPGDPNHDGLVRMREQLMEFRRADGLPYHLVELPLPDPIFDEEGEQLPATYANFLVCNGAVFVPVYGQKLNDELAVMTLKAVFHEHEIVPVDCRALIRQHGSLHCVTMQLPRSAE